MKKYLYLLFPATFLLAFIIFTILVKTVDVQYLYDITGANSYIGFYHFNSMVEAWVNEKNVKFSMSTWTDAAMYVSFIFPLTLGVVFIVEWIKRKSFFKIDRSLFVVLSLFVMTVVMYFIFEIVKINYSPLSFGEEMKVSYPSSHVLATVIFTAGGLTGVYDLLKVKNIWLKVAIAAIEIVFLAVVGVMRLLSENHWVTDIIGSYLLAGFLLTTYFYARQVLVLNKEKENEVISEPVKE